MLPSLVPPSSLVVPSMPTDEDNRRSELTANRHKILDDDFEEIADAYIEEKLGSERKQVLGASDISSNPLSSESRQVSTPGLYGKRPKIRNTSEAAAILIEPGGELDRAGWSPKMQSVQYYAHGLGEYFLRIDAPARVGHLTLQPVSPANIWVWCHPDQPDVPVLLWWRRPRCRTIEGQPVWTYAWDKYDIGDPALDAEGKILRINGQIVWRRPPSFRIEVCTKRSENDDVDITEEFAPGGPYIGETYPWQDDEMPPFIPLVCYRAYDTGLMWNYLRKRGATRGTLNAVMFMTLLGHAAQSASGRAVIAAGIRPLPAEAAPVPASAGSVTKAATSVRSVRLLPGSIAYHEPMTAGGSMLLQEVGPAGELETLAKFTGDYEIWQAIRAGLNPTDVTRQAANPTSGAALAISAKGRREYSAQVEPLYRKADLELLAKAACILRKQGIGNPPSTGYSIQYHPIAQSPDEASDQRDELDWDLQHDLISEVEAYMRRYPGTTAEDAEAAIIEGRRVKARLEKKLADDVAASTGARTDAPSGGAAKGPTLVLAPTDMATVVKVNEARKSGGLGDLTKPDGTRDPDGDLTLAEFKAKHSNVIAEGEAAAQGKTAPTKPGDNAFPPPGTKPAGDKPADPPADDPTDTEAADDTVDAADEEPT